MEHIILKPSYQAATTREYFHHSGQSLRMTEILMYVDSASPVLPRSRPLLLSQSHSTISSPSATHQRHLRPIGHPKSCLALPCSFQLTITWQRFVGISFTEVRLSRRHYTWNLNNNSISHSHFSFPICIEDGAPVFFTRTTASNQ